MITFFVQNASSFLAMGVAALIALLLRAAALRYAQRDEE